jgi:hypothetical protein
MEHLEVRFRAENATDEGVFEGRASAFNVIEPGYNTRFRFGAFSRTLANRNILEIKHLLGHEAKPRSVVGVWDEVKQDAEGLSVRGRLLMELQDAKDTLVRLKAGALDCLSIGFEPVRWEDVREANGQMIRDFLDVDLWEISHVVFGGNPGAKVALGTVRTTIRGLAGNPRELERALRDAGISEKDSKWIVSKCKELPDSMQEIESLNGLLTAIRDTNLKLKGQG